jgi:diguanylate cyclase (GGDEF)-like protein
MFELSVLLVVGPLAVAIALVARHGKHEPRDAVEQLDRLQVAIHRVTRLLDEGLDSQATLEIGLGTVVDAVDAAAGRARVAGAFRAVTFEAVPVQAGARDADALLAVERAALTGRSLREFHGGWWAIAAPLLPRREPESEPIGAIAVCRRDRPFSRDEEIVFEYVTAHAAVALEAIALHERLVELAIRDDLTGLGNHRHFHEALDALVDDALVSGALLSVLLVDMDDFRGINGAFGHATGDEVLRAVGRVVRDNLRITDEAARYAGQQIAVALPGTDLDGACTVAEDIRAGIAALNFRGGTLKVTASVGMAELSDHVASREGLVFAVESALDEAKRAGKDHIAGYQPPARAGRFSRARTHEPR